MIPAGASGGGACPPPLTSGRATSVSIENFCYGPTVVHLRPGESVAWINRDAIEHTVTGANRAFGSYRALKEDRSVTWQFDRAGVYPYYCVLHPGMVGTVVVGGNDALASAGDIDRGDVSRVSELEPSRAELSPVPAAPRASEPDLGIVLLGGAAAAVLLFASARLRRRLTVRRTP